MAVSLFFVFSSNCKRFFVLTPPHPPFLPSVTPFLLPAMIIHHWAGPTFSFPQNQLPIMLIKVGGVGWRGGLVLVWVSNATRLPVAGKESFERAAEEMCFFLFFLPPNDKSQCFPDMTRISKMTLQIKVSQCGEHWLVYTETHVKNRPKKQQRKASTLD